MNSLFIAYRRKYHHWLFRTLQRLFYVNRSNSTIKYPSNQKVLFRLPKGSKYRYILYFTQKTLDVWLYKDLEYRPNIPNSIPINILKEIHETIFIPLSTLVNISFITEKFPYSCKITKVVPIFKSETQLFCNNNRPIFLLSNIGKIIEKIIYLRFNHFLETCCYRFQFGFDLNFCIVEIIQIQLDDGKYSTDVFVDSEKVFYIVDHNILLYKLYYYGIRRIAYKWFESYLKNRKKLVSISDHIMPQVSRSKQVFHCSRTPPFSIIYKWSICLYINDQEFERLWLGRW